MASIVYRTDRKTGAQYAYRSESYRDPVTHRPRNRKEYLGRVDPETGEIIPKRPKKQSGEPQPTPAPKTPTPITDDTDLAARIAALEAEVATLRTERDALAATLARLCDTMETSVDEARRALQAPGDTGA